MSQFALAYFDKKERVGKGSVLRLELNEGITLFGRERCCDVPFRDDRISRRHFHIRVDGEKICITDLNGRNGTFLFLNGEKTKLPPNEEKEIGIGTVICFIDYDYYVISSLKIQ